MKVIFSRQNLKIAFCHQAISHAPKKRSDFQTFNFYSLLPGKCVSQSKMTSAIIFLFILLNLTEIAALPITNMEKKKKNSTPPPLFLSTLGCGRRKRRRKSQLRRRKRRGEGRNCENARRLRIYGKGKGEGEVIPGMESKYVRRGMPPRDIIVPYV